MAATSLPSHFPAGTRYVIEGRRGKSGKLQIVSRQLILPNGQEIEVSPTSHERPRAARLKRRRLTSGHI
jgi:hypothetical protein